MKWIIISLVAIVVVWKAITFFVDRESSDTVQTTTDSLQAKAPVATDSSVMDSVRVDSIRSTDFIDPDTSVLLPLKSIITKGVQPSQIITFAKTLIGVPYLYGSTDPKKGFDCSGFITYVFHHFGISVPRSSYEFTDEGKTVEATQAKPGDLILFTGTNPLERTVGHMGIVIDNSDSVRFIHSSSGRAHGVTITALNASYQKRYMKTIRIFPQND